MNVLLAIFGVLSIVHDSYTANDIQKECLGVAAVKYTPELEKKASSKSSKYYVGSTRKLTEADWPNDVNKNTNICGILTFFSEILGCSEMVTEVLSMNPRKTRTRIFSKKLNNYVSYDEQYKVIDLPFLVYQGELLSMSYTDAAPNSTAVPVPKDKIPAIIIEMEELTFALVGTNENLDWLMYMTCNRKFLWIFYSEEVVANKSTKSFDIEIFMSLRNVFNIQQVPFEADSPST